jgi:hypothetical protein
MGLDGYDTVPQTPTTPSLHYNKGTPLSAPNPVSPGFYENNSLSENGVKGSEPTLLSKELQREDMKLKFRIRYLRLISRLAATSIAFATASQEGLTLRSYFTTHNVIRSGRGPWANDTRLWSSILLFSISVITIIFGLIIILAYFISVKAANSVSSVQSKFAIAVEVGHIAMWIGVAVAYRVAKNGHDLWGWACSPLAQKLQPNFQGVVQFNNVCQRGTRSWHLTIASAAAQLLSLFIWFMVLRRIRHKKWMKRAASGHL